MLLIHAVIYWAYDCKYCSYFNFGYKEFWNRFIKIHVLLIQTYEFDLETIIFALWPKWNVVRFATKVKQSHILEPIFNYLFIQKGPVFFFKQKLIFPKRKKCHWFSEVSHYGRHGIGVSQVMMMEIWRIVWLYFPVEYSWLYA